MPLNERKLTVHTTGNAFSLAGRVEWSSPSNMTAAYTKMHPKAVKLLSFGLDNLIVLYAHKLCMQMEESDMIHCIKAVPNKKCIIKIKPLSASFWFSMKILIKPKLLDVLRQKKGNRTWLQWLCCCTMCSMDRSH